MNLDHWNRVADWLIIFGPSSYRQFFYNRLTGALDFFIEKIVYMNLDQNNQPISDKISKVQVLLNQIFQNIKTHAMWAKKLFF